MGAVKYVLENGIEDKNNRTGQATKRTFGQVIEYRDGCIFTSRACNPGISAAELAWMLSGSMHTDFLNKYTSIWKKFEDEPGLIKTAYGYRWRAAFGRDQIADAIELLKKDPSSRQALVTAWEPLTDGLLGQGRYKNVPCPFAFNIYICHGILNIVVYQRSADLVAGVPYDLMTYWMLGNAFAQTLLVAFGGVSIVFGDLHIYEAHYETAEKMLKQSVPFSPEKIKSPRLSTLEKDPDAFVHSNWKIWDNFFELKEKVQVAQ